MKIIQYSQHVLGMGHFFRSLEIAAALSRAPDTEVILASGGMPVDVPLPKNVQVVEMPPLVMDNSFAGFFNPDGRDVKEVQKERIAQLFQLFATHRPDHFLVELFPFGRKKFRFELLPLLRAIHSSDYGPLKPTVTCSLRDILVERNDQKKYERRVIDTLNSYFHGVIVHADPDLVPLQATFPALDKIRIPIQYTGYVATHPDEEARPKCRARLGLATDQPFVLVSAGAGAVGGKLMQAAAAAYPHLRTLHPGARMLMFTGPGLETATFDALHNNAPKGLDIRRFTPRFPEYMAAADLSVSMAGYNTVMNILATRTPALVLPFDANREQTMRARLLEQRELLNILDAPDLRAETLASRMADMLTTQRTTANLLPKINGSEETLRALRRIGAARLQ